jgi:hypothetical protein
LERRKTPAYHRDATKKGRRLSMVDPCIQLAIEDIADLIDPMPACAAGMADTLEISLMDVVIAVIVHP